MNNLIRIIELFGGIGAVLGALWGLILWINRIIEGQKCQLRADMLHTYYKHLNEKTIHQYEAENFILMYKAYKSLKGNSFVDKVYSEVIKWKVIS